LNTDRTSTDGRVPGEKLDRNWNELLQELRVVQTGVQILTGFLLTLPFQQRFLHLNDFQRGGFLAAVLFAAAATGLPRAWPYSPSSPGWCYRSLLLRRERLCRD
jgi:hypothetical protein